MSTAMIVVIISFLVLMLLGVPVVFALGIPGIIWLLISPNMPVTILAQNMMAYLNSFTLLCLPGFLFVGRLMTTCGVTDRSGVLTKLALILTMYLGRVGPVAFALSLSMRPRTPGSRMRQLPEGKLWVA